MHEFDPTVDDVPRQRWKRAGQVTVIGIGGPVGSGKTALVESLCRTLQTTFQLAVVTKGQAVQPALPAAWAARAAKVGA